MLIRIFKPTIVISYDCNRCVTKLSFTGQKNLGHVGHSNDVSASATQVVTLRARAQSGPLDARVGFLFVYTNTFVAGSIYDIFAESGTGGFSRGNVSHEPSAEVGPFSLALCEVYILVGK